MLDYGIKVSKKDTDVYSQEYADILMSTTTPFAKIDQTKINSFKTTDITFLNNTTINTKTLIHSFKHGYSYSPQVWGLWDITYGAGMGGMSLVSVSGYGTVVTPPGISEASLWYEYDDTDVYLYAYWNDPTGGFVPLSFVGTTASLTTYIFADDLTNQDYS